MKKILTPALTMLLILVAVSPGLASWEEGVTAFRDGRYAEAVDEFQSLVNTNPVAPQGHYMLGLSLLQMRETAAALEPLNEAVELEPNNATYRLALAKTQLEAGEPDAAVATLKAQDLAAVADAERDGFGRLLAQAATRSDRKETALAALEGALAVEADSKTLWLASAHVAQQVGRARQGFDAYAVAYGLDQSDVELGRNTIQTAFANARAKDGEERRSWYALATPIATDLAGADPTAQHFLLAGEALMGEKEYDQARSWFEQAAEADDADPWAHFYLARCASEEPEEALSHLQAALERQPGEGLTPQIHNSRGNALRRLEDFAAAKAAYAVAGNSEKVAEMERLIEIKTGNDKWAAEKSRCEEKQRVVQEQLKDNDFLSGTAAWRKLEQEAEEALADCQPYLVAAD